MKNILLLMPLALLIVACQCEEDAPIIPAEEIIPSDNFFVTLATYEEDSAGQFIHINFNKPLNRETVQLGETITLEGEGLGLEYISVGPNYIELECGNHFWCESDSCLLSLRLTSGIESANGIALDGDRDGKPGGNFREVLTANRCPFDAVIFRVLAPTAENATMEVSTADIISIPVEFSLPVDTFKFFPGENIAILCEDGNNGPPINWQWEAGSNRRGTISLGVGMIWEYCGIGPGERGDIHLLITEETISESGIVLDGDDNGLAGGDFIKAYSINHLQPPVFQIASPNAENESVTYPDAGPLQIRLTFTADVDTTNFTVGEQINIFCLDSEVEVPFQFSWDEGSTSAGTISILPDNIINSCFVDVDSGRSQFTLFVSGNTRSQEGLFLDGNGDGVGGDSFLKNYSSGF